MAFSLWQKIAVVVLFIAAILLITHLGGKKEAPTDTVQANRQVRVASVALLSQNATPLSLLGTVTSRSEATIRAEGGGRLVGVYKKLGDYVAAGGIIAEFDNATERAQLVQAEGAYESATVGRNLAQTGKDIAQINSDSAGTTLAGAKTQSLNTLSSAYTTLDDAVRTKTDTAWRNPQTRDAKLAVTVADSKLIITIEAERVAIESMLRAREERNKSLATESDLVTELSASENEANTVKQYLDDLSLAFTRAIVDQYASQTTIDSYKANTTAARLSVGGALASIAASKTALNATLSATQVASKNVTQGDTQSSLSADAQIKSAQGNLDATRARLEKTIIRSPISGTLNSLSIETGDFVSPFTEVAVVSNNGALEVVSYITDEDARQLTIGEKITIEGGAEGVITKIAPALDPKTKKIEVRIGIVSGASTLINGQSVRIAVLRTAPKVLRNNEPLRIPLSALKITPEGGIVFTVNADNTLTSHKVKEGALLGDQIEIADGITADMEIVTDARGLKEGDVVSIAN